MIPLISNRKVLCPIRGYHVINYPEERVRQKLLKQLLKFNGALQSHIALEVKTALGRADIVIYDEQLTPFLTIELKALNEIINELTLEQVMRYWVNLKSPFVAISNGRHTNIYQVIDSTPKLIKETDIVKFLAIQEIEYPKLMKLKRLPFDLSTYDRYIQYLVENGYVSSQTITDKQRWFSELQNALLTETYTPTERELPIYIEADFGTSYYAFKNAANGAWDGMHRSFRVDVKNRGSFVFRISMIASATSQNDPTFGNRKGATSLNIAMQTHSSSTYNLQLNLDKYTKESMVDYTIWHSGVKSRMKKEKVLRAVAQFAPNLLNQQSIELATLPTERSITFEEFSLFIENLILYSVSRDFALTI
ncbi:type I restriction enzyme HsdR N-terminal domain-containing protein [Sporosarcina beigongshangi]|uniref:type I restriction enzyme HsdR N-terminal domain-containing protein n=1 Tax=Sporosarcina beigongshangi TaxID=2782538 RepID=UPI0019397858|nr:type I restriction enzyme HsdR N-terminal domain-containing protein [Sporosarcina beigongshangi]